VRLLHLRGRSAEACALASAAEQDAARRSDDLLGLTYRLLRASILVETGEAGEATAVIKDLVIQGDRLSKAQRVELDRILAQYYAGQGNEPAARDHALRAVRLQDSFSNAVTKVQLRQTVRALGLDTGGQAGDPGTRELDAVLTAREPALDPLSLKAVEQLAFFASQPDLLGREVLSVLWRTACVERASIRSVSPSQTAPSEEPSGGPLTIPLGSFLGRRYFIDVVPRDDIASQEALMTIARLARTAVRYHEAEAREAAKTAIWRFDPVASEGVPVATSAAMQEVLSTIHLLATSDAPVLITGETGTGKEVFARELHRASGAKGPFLPFNCSAVSKDMLDAQLFGHRKGAFTSATESLPGVVRSAAGGTLFLDEIGELDPDLQPKLLRLLDRSEVHPLGEPQPITVRVRLVAATNAKVEELMAQGRFRADLFYRLVGRVILPPLRERREEIPAFAEHFLEGYARERSKPRLTLSDEAIEALLLFRWPGNVRQLAGEMRRLVTFCTPGSVVRVSDLAPDIAATRRAASETADAGEGADDQVRVDLAQPLQDAVDQLERALIERALELEHGHRERAAERLGLSRKGLFLKLKRLGIEP
jgi:DNA-binding NtrC family response regulator